MRNYKLVVQYDGTRYNGWQSQENTSNTIQEKIENVLNKMTGKTVKIQGSGRTDAGVHAEAQIANVFMDTDMSTTEITSYLNSYLPEDIKVTEVTEASERFHSRLNAIGKVYLYKIDTNCKSDVFRRKYIYTLGKDLDLLAMKKAAELLCGTHDYKSFCSKASKKKSTLRTVTRIDIEKQGSEVWIYFEGSGFLHNMVRIMTGTLIEVGLGKRTPESMLDLLKEKDRKKSGETAPAQGLCLVRVLYH